MTIAYLGLGSNVGDRQKNIDRAIAMLGAMPGTKVIKISTIIDTEPVGGPPQGRFLNGAMKVDTSLTPRELLGMIKKIEKDIGRIPSVTNGPRIIDIDILLYGDLKVDEPDLKIPHPRMREREFVKRPLAEISAGDAR